MIFRASARWPDTSVSGRVSGVKLPQLSTSAEFTEILHDSGELPPGLSYTMPGDILPMQFPRIATEKREG